MSRHPVSICAAAAVALVGASAVLFGAFGAHALRDVLSLQGRELWHTAVEYHMWHALALTLAVAVGHGRSARISQGAFVIGMVLFSGSLYALALGAPRWVGIVTPFGGLAFVCGWIALGVSLRTRAD